MEITADTHTAFTLNNVERLLVPTEMLAAVVADTKAAGFVNETAAEALSYELLDIVTHDEVDVDLAEFTAFIARTAGI